MVSVGSLISPWPHPLVRLQCLGMVTRWDAHSGDITCIGGGKNTSTPLKQQQKQKQQHQHWPSDYSRGCEGKATPPPLMEEEAVKEVLSETPAPKPPPTEVEEENTTPPSPKLALKKVEEEEKIQEKVPVSTVEEISEISEICSMSESVSTTTITERRDDDERSRDECEVRQRVLRSPARFLSNHRPPSGDLGGKREWGVGKSPARRSEPSPGKVRSPATRSDNGASRSGIGRSPSARKTGQSPSRVPAAAAPGSSRNVEQTEKEGKWPPPPATNESLENPLVSLECFIFL
uniref:Uncharacterized protein n=1 Tax=Vitis vinifera TaxID=29760 RepID=A5CB80_VITVI|nr:hypothetical protein VITISV_021768 [Vitis vinifera]